MKAIFLPIALLLIVSGCSLVDADEPAWTQTFETLQPSFSFSERSVDITATYRNESDQEVQLSPCGLKEYVVLQKLVSGSYRTVYHPICQAIGRTPTVIAPGESLEVILHVSDDPSTEPQLTTSRDGLYRLLLPGARDERGRRGSLQSNPFVIEG